MEMTDEEFLKSYPHYKTLELTVINGISKLVIDGVDVSKNITSYNIRADKQHLTPVVQFIQTLFGIE